MSNKINVYFLGTSSSTPTKERNLTSMLVKYQGENYLFDSPENVQQQIMKAKQSIIKINNIFITHMHGDHFFGILGLLATMQLNQRETDINIYVPFGDKKKIFDFIKYSLLKFSFKIKIIEVKANQTIDLDLVEINIIKLNHSLPTYGYNLKVKDKIGKFNKFKALKLEIPEGPLFRKLQEGKSIKINGKIITAKQVMDYNYKKIGKSISYITDTYVLPKVPKSVIDTDILVHESCFLEEHKDRAKEMLHSVAGEVGKFAKKAKAKQLYLIHISPRYLDGKESVKEAKKFFKNTKSPKDLNELEVIDYV